MNFDELKIYLPKFLSQESDNELYSSLRDFPDNIDGRLYTNYLSDSELIYQGDGIKEMLVINLPKTDVKPAPSIILSNTCDIDLDNPRNFPSQIVYSPIFNLEKYRQSLIAKSNKTVEQINAHIASIKRQEPTQIFYLPKLEGRLDESIVFLDRVNNLPSKFVERATVPEKRIFTLSDYGAYLFLLKLSIHFTRIKTS
jgi:hypothetical protein